MSKLLPVAILLASLVAAACSDSAGKQGATTPTTQQKAVGEGGFVIVNPGPGRPFFVDFGRVVYGERLKHVFQLENKEGRPLTVRDMLASCGCTQPRISYIGADGERVEGSNERGVAKHDVIVIPKGVVAEVVVEIDTTLVETMNIDKLAQVRIRTDSDANPYLTLELHLVVVRAFRAVPAKLELGEVPQSAGKSARTDVTTDQKDNGSRIKGILRIDGTFEADLQTAEVNGETVWIVTATAPPGLPFGPTRGSITFTTTNADGQGNGAPFTVPILAQVVPDVVVHPGAMGLTVESAKGGSLEAEMLALVPGARVKVLSAKVEGEGAEKVRVEAVPSSPDDDGRATRHVLKLTAPPGLAPGAIAGRIVVQLDDPDVPQIVVPFTVNVRG